MQTFREEIAKYEGGKEFLEAWEKVYMVGGVVTGSVLLAASFYKIGLKLLALPEIIKNVKLQKHLSFPE